MFKTVTVSILILTATGAAAQDCTPIRFTSGESGAFVDGVLPPKDPFNAGEPTCYSVDVRAGQPMFIEVVAGDENVAVSVIDVGDARRSFAFAAPSNRVEFLVFQLFPSPEPADYSLLVRAD